MAKKRIKNNNSALRIKIATSRDAFSQFPMDIIIVPTYSAWNDFGYLIRAEIGLRTKNGTLEWVNAYVAFKGKNNLAAFVKERSGPGGAPLSMSELGLPYASMLTESKSYSLIRRIIGVEEGRRLLLAINDVAILQMEDESVPDWPDFFTSDVFTHAMTRSSEGHFAFRHGALFLAGRKTSGVDARQRISVDLTRYGPTLHFDFRFDSSNALRGRIAVIIGKNGCGKTSSLARLAAGFATEKRQGVVFSERPVVNQVMVFAHSGALRLFKQRRDRSNSASVRAFSLDPSTAVRSSARAKHTSLLVDIARANDDEFKPFDYFKRLIKEEFSGLVMYVPVRPDEDSAYPIDSVVIKGLCYVDLHHWFKGGEGKRLAAIGYVDHERDLLLLDATGSPRALSLGQAAFLNFSLNALANAGPASIILCDEPENFLHPNLISRFMRVLHSIVEATKSIAIISTHSPFVVREVQSAQVHVLCESSEGGFVEVAQPRLQTLGANVASIANEVFSDDLPAHLYELMLNKSKILTMPFDVILEDFAGELSTEALMYLRRRGNAKASEADY